MPPTTARRTPARGAHARTRSAPAPRHHRRISGPIARPVPAVALPQPVRRGTTGVFERLRALPETRVVDRLLRGRVWIWLIGLMLGGIVAMQVSLLKLNSGISASVEQAASLERRNAALETEVAKLAAGARIQQAAASEGMVAPPAGDVSFLTARPGADPRLAARRMQSPSEEAADVMANGGRSFTAATALTTLPTDPATAATTTTTATTATTATDPAAVTTTDPAATAVPPAPTPTPEPVATPVPTPVPGATDPATGATTAPTG